MTIEGYTWKADAHALLLRDDILSPLPELFPPDEDPIRVQTLASRDKEPEYKFIPREEFVRLYLERVPVPIVAVKPSTPLDGVLRNMEFREELGEALLRDIGENADPNDPNRFVDLKVTGDELDLVKPPSPTTADDAPAPRPADPAQ